MALACPQRGIDHDQTGPGGGGSGGGGWVGQRFVGDGSRSDADRVATTVNNLASGYTIINAANEAGRRVEDEVRRNGLLHTVLKGATVIFR